MLVSLIHRLHRPVLCNLFLRCFALLIHGRSAFAAYRRRTSSPTASGDNSRHLSACPIMGIFHFTNCKISSMRPEASPLIHNGIKPRFIPSILSKFHDEAMSSSRFRRHFQARDIDIKYFIVGWPFGFRPVYRPYQINMAGTYADIAARKFRGVTAARHAVIWHETDASFNQMPILSFRFAVILHFVVVGVSIKSAADWNNEMPASKPFYRALARWLPTNTK